MRMGLIEESSFEEASFKIKCEDEKVSSKMKQGSSEKRNWHHESDSCLFGVEGID